MFYTSKRRNFSNFFRTRNWKYYAAVLLIFIVLTAVIILIAKQTSDNPDTNEETDSSTVDSTTEKETVSSVAGKYRLDVNLGNNQISVFSYDNSKGAYDNTPVKYMLFAYSDDLSEGTYSSSNDSVIKATWFTAAEDTYYRYYVDFGSNISFHSSAYTELNNKNSLSVESYSDIGEGSSSSGDIGITLLCSDARWIYENCSAQSEVVIYSDDTEAISNSATAVIDIPATITWEPTDTSDGTPWCQTRVESLNVNSAISVTVGAANLTSFASATDSNDGSVSQYVYITGTYNLQAAGSYTIVYNIADIYGNHLTRSVTLNVTEPETTAEETTTHREQESTSTGESATTEEAESEEATSETDAADEHAE